MRLADTEFSVEAFAAFRSSQLQPPRAYLLDPSTALPHNLDLSGVGWSSGVRGAVTGGEGDREEELQDLVLVSIVGETIGGLIKFLYTLSPAWSGLETGGMDSGQTQAHARHQHVPLPASAHVRPRPGPHHSYPLSTRQEASLPCCPLLFSPSLRTIIVDVGGVSGVPTAADPCETGGGRPRVTAAQSSTTLLREKSSGHGRYHQKVPHVSHDSQHEVTTSSTVDSPLQCPLPLLQQSPSCVTTPLPSMSSGRRRLLAI